MYQYRMEPWLCFQVLDFMFSFSTSFIYQFFFQDGFARTRVVTNSGKVQFSRRGNIWDIHGHRFRHKVLVCNSHVTLWILYGFVFRIIVMTTLLKIFDVTYSLKTKSTFNEMMKAGLNYLISFYVIMKNQWCSVLLVKKIPFKHCNVYAICIMYIKHTVSMGI